MARGVMLKGPGRVQSQGQSDKHMIVSHNSAQRDEVSRFAVGFRRCTLHWSVPAYTKQDETK